MVTYEVGEVSLEYECDCRTFYVIEKIIFNIKETGKEKRTI